MNRLSLTVLVAALSASGAFVQNALAAGGNTASEPTKTTAGGTGPQDSVGTSGASPTKSLMLDKNKDKPNNPERSAGDTTSGSSGDKDDSRSDKNERANMSGSAASKKSNDDKQLNHRKSRDSNGNAASYNGSRDSSAKRPSGNSEHSGR